MKKSFLVHSSYFLTLLFLVMIAPIFLSSDANAACLWTPATAANGSTAATGGSCSGSVDPGDTGPVCTARTDQISCTSSIITGDANKNAFVTTICSALKIITGNGGKAFAAFAIISLGIGFFTGKVSWGLMIGVAAGIAAMFGAPTIVAAISGGSAYNCGTGGSL